MCWQAMTREALFFCKDFKRKDGMISFRTLQVLKTGILETDICVAS